MATSLSGTITDGGSQFAVSINSTDGTAINSSRPTWLIIHGWDSDPARFADMVSAIRAQRPTDQILTLDWQTAAEAGPLLDNPGVAENRIPLVAAWAATALINAGFSGTNLSEIGHDFGANIAGEIAELIPGGVNNIVALNPFGDIAGNNYNPEGAGGVNFAQYSQYSWAFHDAEPDDPAYPPYHALASRSAPVTADEAYDVKNSYNAAIPSLFTFLVNNPNYYIIGQNFGIQRLVNHQPAPWQSNYYDADGAYSPGGGYEAVITVTGDGDVPISLAYISGTGTVSINDATVTETNGNTTITFTVTRSGGTGAFWVSYNTSDGSATTASSDYNSSGGILRFDANDTTKTFTVDVFGDYAREPNETFFVNLFSATNGVTITDAQGVGTILNDDNSAPRVGVLNAVRPATPAQSIAVSSLFIPSDGDGDTLTYYLYDDNASASSGHFVVNGTIVPAQTIYILTAAQFAQTTFVAGVTGNADGIYLKVYDGIAYSDWSTRVEVSVGVNHSPIVTAPQPNKTVLAAQSIAVSSMFNAFDSDGDALTYYLYDSNSAANSGYFVVGGVTVPAQTIYQLTAAQFAQATFVAGTGGTADDILVQAFDGKVYSGWNTSVHVAAVANRAPVITALQTNVTAPAGQSISLANPFMAWDPDGDQLTFYVYDSNAAANSGHIIVGGMTVPAQTIYAMTLAQFTQAAFVTGAAGVADDILVQVSDGKAYSGWNTGVHFTAEIPFNNLPVVQRPQGGSVNAAAGQSVAVSSLFSGNDLDGDTLSYFLYDSNTAANSGHFVVDGVTVPAQTIYALTAAQFAQATFVAGAAGVADDILVQAFDGKGYSGWNTSVKVSVPVNHAPTVSLPWGASVNTTPAQGISMPNLFSGSDPDGDALSYFLYDANPAANSGYFVLNGMIIPARTIYPLTAAQFTQTGFIAGSDGTFDDIYVQAFDGKAYSGWNTSVHVTASVPNNAPTVDRPAGTNVAANAGQTLQLSNLFSGTDINGDTLSYFVYDANADANSGHVEIGGNVVAARTITAMTAAELAQATFVAGDAGTADDIFVQAFDGKAYSGWAAGVHIFV